MREATEVKPFEIWPENWETVEMFMELQTQWIYAGMGVPIGIPVPAMKALFDIRGIPRAKRHEALRDLQVMEYAALKVLGERTKEGGA